MHVKMTFFQLFNIGEQQGAELYIKGELFEITPLHFACEKSHLSIVKYLISAGENNQRTN